MIQNNKENEEKLKKYLKQRDEINIDIVELFKAISISNGVSTIKATKDIKEASSYLKKSKHTIFILLDGFGYEKLNSMPESSVLKSHFVRKINTVNPTSTACVLTSILSCSYPNEHGIYGWWDYNKEYKLDYFPLLFEERKTKENLKEKGINYRDIYKFEPVFNKFKTKVNVYTKKEIINSDYTKMFAGNSNRYSFYSIRDCFKKLKNNLQKENKETFNYIYIDGLDLASHAFGVNSKEVMNIIEETEKGIKMITNDVIDVSIILTADHGQIPMKQMLYLNQTYDFNQYFYALPSIDTRCVSFFVKEEAKEEFEKKFMELFGQDVILLTKEQVKELNLFGKEKFTPHAEDSLGEYIAIVTNEKFLVCDFVEKNDMLNTKGNHSGLTKEETIVPLVII